MFIFNYLIENFIKYNLLHINYILYYYFTASGTELLPALLLIHGDSYSWGAGNPLDGIALAAHGRIIVVSINFRLGVLGNYD